jgi:hypothetical protein
MAKAQHREKASLEEFFLCGKLLICSMLNYATKFG